MLLILQTWCQIQLTSSSFPYVYCVRDIYNVTTVPHIQAAIINWTYLRRYWRYLDNSMSVTLQIWCQIQRTSSSLRYVNYRRGHIQCIYSSAYWGFNIHLNVSALLLEISWQFNARDTAFLVPNTAHILQFTLCELWSRSYTIHFAPHIQTSIFIWTYLRCYWKYLDNSKLVILQTWCQIQRTSSGLRYVNYENRNIYKVFSAPHI
jgi:hypothetical protein